MGSENQTTGGARLDAARYALGQGAHVLWRTAQFAAIRRLAAPATQPGEAPYAQKAPRAAPDGVTQAYFDAFRADAAQIRAGTYQLPPQFRRPPHLSAALREFAALIRDAREVAAAKSANDWRLPLEKRVQGMPSYYLRRFHFQTDGWLSDESARLYDAQVEALFMGAAAAMRRQALAVLARILEDRDPRSVHLVDLATGAGALLEDALDNHPALSATAIDLSANYLRFAQRRLKRYRKVRIVNALAESIPLSDESADIVMCCYLFHELPKAVRREVVGEISRILKPGGSFVLIDAIQTGDDPRLDSMLENFPREFHEPYYSGYMRENLEALGAPVDLRLIDERLSFLTKTSHFLKN